MVRPEGFWDIIARNYDSAEDRFELLHTRTLAKTREYLDSSGIVLDYGCATGTKTLELADCVARIHGIDISSRMIEASRRKAAEHYVGNVDFERATIEDVGFDRESFDVVLVFNILHALEDPQQVVQRIEELLCPGGLLISVTPCLGKRVLPRHRIQFSIFLILSRTRLIPYVAQFRFSELERLIDKGNLEIVDAEKLFQDMSSYFIIAKKK